ncbi:MAG: hypothetical protein AUK35_05465 [Zetaproteobacteria bacterium CG2_30_46_52]|nr:MAG: hypothetical protein AUK35_05465 [Zetaproteobacteria bacterium CG2_30_46_52]
MKIIYLTFLLLLTMEVSAQELQLGQFSQGSRAGWESKSFAGETIYTLVTDEQLTRQVLQAKSDNSASGLFYKKNINLLETPFLNWSWKVNSLLSGHDENQKSGDDFVARIYVVVDGGVFFWNTRALNYVWSSKHKLGEVWDNPFTSNATMIAAEAGDKHLGVWQTMKRNVREDFKQLLGKDIQSIDAIAVMTDTDNTGQSASAWFGDIFFTSQ